MKTRKTGNFVLLSVLLVLGMVFGSIPGTSVLAQDVSPAADPIPTFADVPATHWSFQFVETFYHAGMTTGCAVSPFRYCPDRLVTRAETAVFLLRSMNGGDYVPPVASGTFADVPVLGKEWMESWIEQFYADGLTTGCGLDPLKYCPERTVTRAELAVFVLRAVHGTSYVPPVVTSSSFSDVPVAGKEWMMPWIEEFYQEGFTTGCYQTPTLQYCPERGLNRAEMATFLVRAFNIVDPRGVAPEDFSVMNFSGVVGYNVGFHLVDSTYADVASVVVKLFDGTTLLATNTATAKFFTDFASGTIQSSPFDVMGTFDYVADGYWDNTGWAGEVWTLPTKAEIRVTFKNGVVRTAENTLLTGDTSIFFLGDVVAQDFGVFDGPEVIGYTVGFGLVDAKVSDTTGIVVKLYNGTTELATATSTAKIYTDFPNEIQLSAPFDVLGTFNYAADGYWTYSGWSGFTSVIPDKAEITVTFKNGLVKTATNTLLTGDTSIFTKGDVVAQDFGVYVNEGVNLEGYSVGFGLVDAVASDATGVVVKLYKGLDLLATATSTGLLANYPTATNLSAPFDVLGTFDYVADGNWSYSGWAGFTSVIPDKAEITVTFKNGLVKTATNTLLTGDTSIFTKGDVAAEDFGVFDGPEVIGYTVGWHLVDATYSDVEGIVVKLYDDTTELATATATAKVFTDFPDATQLSAPFDVVGTFDYVADGYWTYSGWLGSPLVLPDKAEITVTFKNGLVKTATNTSLTGDISIFAPVLTKPASNITVADGRMNGLTGPVAVTGRTFWVSAAPIVIPENHNRPAGVFATIDLGALAAYTPFNIYVSTVPDLAPITPDTIYYYVAWVKIDGVWYHGEVMSFTTATAP